MKKQQFKKAALLGLSAAALTAAGAAGGSILEQPGVILAGNCGSSGCNHQSSTGYSPSKRGQVAMEDAKPVNGGSCNAQGASNGATGATQKSGNGCSGASKSGNSCSASKSGNGCAGRK